MNKIFKKMLAVGMVAAMSLSLFACAGSQSNDAAKTETDKLKEIQDRGVLTMGCSADFPPYEFLDISTGTAKIAGFDIMLAEEICADLGVELKIDDRDFDGLIAALNAGNVDIVISGMNATEERKEQVLFSDEYYFGDQCVLVRKTEADSYNVTEDFSGKRLGAQTGSIQEEIVDEVFVEAGAEKFAIANVPNLVLELKSNRIDGLVLDLPIAEAFVRQHDDLVIAPCPVAGEESGFAIAMTLGSETLADAINATLTRLKDEGKIDQYFTEAVELAQQQEAQQ